MVALNAVIALAYYVRAAAILYAGPVGIAVADLRPPKLPVSLAGRRPRSAPRR